jgi:hypothetical protein
MPSIKINTDCASVSTTIIQMPFKIQIGWHLYEMGQNKEIIYTGRAKSKATGSCVSVFTSGGPNIIIEYITPSSVKIEGYITQFISVDDYYFIFTKSV